MMRVFLDANVLFTAAHNLKGKAALVIALGSEGLLQLTTSRYAKEEATRNLARKFPSCLVHFKRQQQAILLVPDRASLPCPAELADVLLTGDLRDFGFLMNAPERSDGLLIQTVADFLNTFKA